MGQLKLSTVNFYILLTKLHKTKETTIITSLPLALTRTVCAYNLPMMVLGVRRADSFDVVETV